MGFFGNNKCFDNRHDGCFDRHDGCFDNNHFDRWDDNNNWGGRKENDCFDDKDFNRKKDDNRCCRPCCTRCFIKRRPRPCPRVDCCNSYPETIHHEKDDDFIICCW